MELKVEKKTVLCCDGRNVENFIKEFLGVGAFSIDEISNDSDYSFTVLNSPPSEYDQEKISRIKQDQCCNTWDLGCIMSKACVAGLVEPGSYLMNVCW